MPTPTLVALLDARPDRPFWGRSWVEDTFSAHLPGYRSGSDSRICGWSVGASLGAETLVQSRPIVRGTDVDPLDDFLRAKAACTVGLFFSSPVQDDQPHPGPRTARFRRWVAASVSTALSEGTRGTLTSALPPYLARDAPGKTDAHLLLLSTLGTLFGHGGFRPTFVTPEVLRDALVDLAPHLAAESGPRAFFLSDGRTLGVVHSGGCLLTLRPPQDLWPRARLTPGSTAPSVPASMLVWSPEIPATPVGSAERIADGIFTIRTSDPGPIVR